MKTLSTVILFFITLSLSNIANAAAPTVTINPYYTRGSVSVYCRGTVAGSGITERGICWSMEQNPTITDNKVIASIAANFLVQIKGLNPRTTYYVKAYAIKDGEVGYSDEIVVRTLRKGKVTYGVADQWEAETYAADYERLRNAAQKAVEYYNNYTSIPSKYMDFHLNPWVPTAQAGYGGYIEFGTNASYQRTGTALHEMAHTIGVGTHSVYWQLMNGSWSGKNATNVVRFMTNSSSALVYGDGTHFWPYGINGAHEDDGSDLSYTINCMIVQAMREDGLPSSNATDIPEATQAFKSDAQIKYYIKNESKGLNTAFLIDNDGKPEIKTMSSQAALENDAAAWYIEFDESRYNYMIRNAASGNYLKFTGTNSSSGNNLIVVDGKDSESLESHLFQFINAGKPFFKGDEDHSIYAEAFSMTLEDTYGFQTFYASGTTTTGTAGYSKNSDRNWYFFTQEDIENFDAAISAPYSQKFKWEEDAVYIIKADNSYETATFDYTIAVNENDSKLYLKSYDGNDSYQQWKISMIEGTGPSESSKYYYFQNRGTGKYLTLNKWIGDDPEVAEENVFVTDLDEENSNQRLRVIFAENLLDDNQKLVKAFAIDNNNKVSVNGIPDTRIFRLDHYGNINAGEQILNGRSQTGVTPGQTQRWIIEKLNSGLGIKQQHANKAAVYANNRTIIVSSETPLNVFVYAIDGKLIRQTTEKQIPVGPGCYIIKAGKEYFKVLVK